uniref:Uncharacterized protein n=1 Tax=Opuntia streptacantha TaxID=393608 RepID=A0A7C9AGZ0_OPUST
MDRYLVPTEPSTVNPKPIRRPRWKRAAIELNGRIESKYRREMCGLMIQSYSEIGVFPHLYHIDGAGCLTHRSRVMAFAGLDYEGSSRRYGVSALEFDTQGIYLASVTKAGCLMVHDFESLYCQSNVISPWLKEDETKHLLHIPTHRQLDAVRWNPANQDEVACTSLKSSEIYIFDVAYVSSEPVEVLRKRPAVTIHGSDIHKGLSDVAFASSGDSRVFACDTYGSINIWDRRSSTFPSMELSTNSQNALNSMQLEGENHLIAFRLSMGLVSRASYTCGIFVVEEHRLHFKAIKRHIIHLLHQ